MSVSDFIFLASSAVGAEILVNFAMAKVINFLTPTSM